jgi:hypothetical protein
MQFGNDRKGRKQMSKTTWQQTFQGSPRYAAIESVFKLIDKPNVLVNEIWKKVGEVSQTLNADERDRLPAFVRAALVGREPVRTAPLPMV